MTGDLQGAHDGGDQEEGPEVGRSQQTGDEDALDE